MKSIYGKVFELLENKNTKIAKKAFDILNEEGIANIIEDNGVFWFETYSFGNSCPNYIYEYLIRFIKRKLTLRYLYDDM